VKRDDIVTIIQTAKVRSVFGNSVADAIWVETLDGILSCVIKGQDRYQILSWLNHERSKAGKDKRDAIDKAWKLVEDELP